MNSRLSLLTFPQRYDGARLHLRILVVPRLDAGWNGDPLQPLIVDMPALGDMTDAFADADLQFEACVLMGLDRFPSSVPPDLVAPLRLSPVPLPPPEAVLHADEHLIVCDKPAGLLAVPGRGDAGDHHLLGWLRERWPDADVVHRLDMATSGLMMFAPSYTGPAGRCGKSPAAAGAPARAASRASQAKSQRIEAPVSSLRPRELPRPLRRRSRRVRVRAVSRLRRDRPSVRSAPRRPPRTGPSAWRRG